MRGLQCFEKSRGIEVAGAGRSFEVAQQNRAICDSELREGINHLKTQQNMLLSTMERKDWQMKGASEEILNKFCKEILNLEENLNEG